MPDFTRLPNYQDVEGLMKSASYWPPDSNPGKQALAREQAETGAFAAAKEWERATGFNPFLVSPSAAIAPLEFDLKGPVTLFDGGALEIESVAIDGQTMPAGSWRALPRNAPATEWPYEALTWAPYVLQRYRRSSMLFAPTVTVRARWGFCTVCPGDAWQQILQAAGLITLTQIENLQSIASISQDGFSKAWDIVGILTQKDTADRWKREFPLAIKRYTRLIC